MLIHCNESTLQKCRSFDGTFFNSQAGAGGNWLLLEQLTCLLGGNPLSVTPRHPDPQPAGKFFLPLAMAVGTPELLDRSLGLCYGGKISGSSQKTPPPLQAFCSVEV